MDSKIYGVKNSASLIINKVLWDGEATCPVDGVLEEVRKECAKYNVVYDKTDKVWRRKKTHQEHGWSKLEFSMPLYALDDDGKEQVYADATHSPVFCTIYGKPDDIVRQMYEWYADNGFDIEDTEFELDGEVYECHSTAMHFHYGEGAITFEEMMDDLKCIPLQEVLPELNALCRK